MAVVFLPIVTAGAIEVVATVGDLPSDQPIGSARYVETPGNLYIFDGVTWVGASGGLISGVTDTSTVDLTVSLGVLSADVIQAGIDHGAISGLADDDHLQYHTDTRALTWLGTRSTSDLPEGSNLYYTDERVDDRVDALIQDGTGLTWTYSDVGNTLTGDVSLSAFDTDDLAEGTTNLYYTDERVDDRVDALIQDGTGLTWTYNDGANTLTGNVSLSAFDTDDLAEGSTNEYYTDAKVDGRITLQKGAANGLASLDSGGKVPASQLPNSIMDFLGTWAASTNTPTLANGVGNAGDVYIASDAGTVDFGAGNITFAAGDWVIYSGSIWEKSVNSNTVASVNGYTGIVVLSTTDIGEGTNLYFTDERVDDRVSNLLVAGNAVTLTYNDPANTLTIDADTATSSVPGVVSTTAQSVAGLKTFIGGTASIEYVGTNPEVGGSSPFTLNTTHKRVQVINPSGAIVVVLDDSYAAGDTVKIVNRSDFDVEIQADDASALTLDNGVNSDATTRNGYVTLMALVSSPSTATDWRVVDVLDDVQFSSTTTIANTLSVAVHLVRCMNTVSASVAIDLTGSGGGGNAEATTAGDTPARFRPDTDKFGSTSYQLQGLARPSVVYIAPAGEFVFINYDHTITGPCWGVPMQFTYLLVD